MRGLERKGVVGRVSEWLGESGSGNENKGEVRM